MREFVSIVVLVSFFGDEGPAMLFVSVGESSDSLIYEDQQVMYPLRAFLIFLNALRRPWSDQINGPFFSKCVSFWLVERSVWET